MFAGFKQLKECFAPFITILRSRMPYRTFETDKGGNAALMAPEVVTAMPGTFTNINYTKVLYVHEVVAQFVQ